MPSFRKAALFLALAASQTQSSAGFMAPHGPRNGNFPNKVTTKDTKVARDMSSTTPPGVEDIFQRYGENSRQYRRTVYTHEDWVRHRSSDRFARNLSTFTSSSIYRSLFKEVTATTSVAIAVVLWNMVFGDYQDLQSITHPGPLHDSLIPILCLPLAPFTLSSPSLGLLLVFRTNTSYKRWDEARKNWGMNINHTRDLVRMGNAYYDRGAVSPETADADLEQLALSTWAFVRSMKRHLSPEWDDEESFKKELTEKLPAEQAQMIIDAAHRPNRALQDLSTAIEKLPMHFMRKNEVQRAATIFEDNLGSSERLLTSPIPVFYSRHTARFLSFWLLLLPFGLWGPLGNTWNHIGLIPTISMLSIFLFGIEELATQLEEPFTILPMQAFCDKIYNWCKEIVSFEPGDNGMPVYYYDNSKMDTDNISVTSDETGAPVYSFDAPEPITQPEVPELVDDLSTKKDAYSVAYEAAMAAASAAISSLGVTPEPAQEPVRAVNPYTPPPSNQPEPVAYTAPEPEPVVPAPAPAAPVDAYTAQYNAMMAASNPQPVEEETDITDQYTAQFNSQMAASVEPMSQRIAEGQVEQPELMAMLEEAAVDGKESPQTVTTETTVTTTTSTTSVLEPYNTGNYLDDLTR